MKAASPAQRLVFCARPPIPSLGRAKLPLDRSAGLLHFGAEAGFAPCKRLLFGMQPLALARTDRSCPSNRLALAFYTLPGPQLPRVTIANHCLALSQGLRLGDGRGVGRRGFILWRTPEGASTPMCSFMP